MAVPMTIKRAQPGGIQTFDDNKKPPATITPGEIMEQVLVKGDLKNLTEAERARYYTRVCESVKLNPLTRPFEYITLNGKLTLYARKDATDQLRTIHKVSVIETEQQEMEGIYIIICKVQNGEGRTLNSAKSRATAVSARSPPESRLMLCSRLPGGRATMSMPDSSTSSSSSRMRFASPPLKSFV